MEPARSLQGLSDDAALVHAFSLPVQKQNGDAPWLTSL
jgi:hypothetical protein